MWLVLYLYEFTLLSNIRTGYRPKRKVLYLYEFTLLSNYAGGASTSGTVLYLYEFTLLSNAVGIVICPQQFYTSMNLHYSQTQSGERGRQTEFYTSMNLHYSQTVSSALCVSVGFIPLWIYITLKRLWTVKDWLCVLYLYEFTLLSN